MLHFHFSPLYFPVLICGPRKKGKQLCSQAAPSFLHVQLFTMTAFLCFIPKMMPPQFFLRMFLPSEFYSHIRDHFISLITVFPLLHSKDSPFFFSKCISHVFKRSLSHLVVSWGNHTFRVSGKVSNLLLSGVFLVTVQAMEKKFC